MFKKNKDILNIALPAMGENFLQMLMGMVDSYLVAHLGLIAISGVSVASNIITIYQAIFIALGAAISSVISKSLGQKDQSISFGRGCDFVVTIKTSIYEAKVWTGQRLADFGFACSGRTSHDEGW